jgi:hypothetical protein
MLKPVIATLAVSAAALLSTVTATPSFAATTAATAATATTNVPLVIGPQVTITVSCPKDHHAVDHSGQLSCARDRRHHKAQRHVVKQAPRPAATTPSQWTQTGAPWHHCHHGWAGNNWRDSAANTWL